MVDKPLRLEQFDIRGKLLELLKEKFKGSRRQFAIKMGEGQDFRGKVDVVVYNKAEDGPPFDTVLRWLAACDTTLGEFFSAPPAEYGHVNKLHHDRLEEVLNSGDQVSANAVTERLAQEWRNVRGSPLQHQGGNERQGGATGKLSRTTSKPKRRSA